MKNKTRKLIPYLAILLIVFGFGFFGLSKNTEAQSTPTSTQAPPVATGKCFPPGGGVPFPANEASCPYNFVPYNNSNNPAPATPQPLTEETYQGPSNDFEKALGEYSCGIIGKSSFTGCLVWGMYYIFYVIPAFLLGQVAYFFNILIYITIGTDLFKSTFLSSAWTVVRDMSNIFFILILLYIAIQTILGLGGHDTKKMIGKVVIIALLINFSMFFTNVIIDSSNILASIFYNKLKTDSPAPYESMTGENDISGGLVSAFNPTSALNEDFFKAAKIIKIPGQPEERLTQVPLGMILGIILVTGLVLIFAVYALFISGLSFVGRLIELFVLIIFSPFAFMSFSVPFLSGIDYIGWNAWFKRLLSVSFMAPIFMFFLYFIFMLTKENIFSDTLRSTNGEGIIMKLLRLAIPAMIILILLLKAADFAKKGSGKFGEMVMSGLKLAGGLAVGVGGLTAGGLAFAGRNVPGRLLAGASRAKGAVDYGKARAKWELAGKTGKFDDYWQKYKAENNIQKDPGIRARIGGRINASQMKAGEIDHGRHELDEARKAAGLEGVDAAHTSGFENTQIESKFIKGKEKEIQDDIIRGHDGKRRKVEINTKEIDDQNGDQIKGTDGAPIVDKDGRYIIATGRDDFKQKRREALVQKERNLAGITDPSIELPDATKKKIEDNLNSEFNEILKHLSPTVGKQRFETIQHEAAEKVGILTRATSRTTGGTYDVRNIAGAKVDKREGLGLRATAGLITAVAAGMRLGLKKTTGTEIGGGQGDIWKDLRHTLGESFKNMKIDIKMDSGGGHAPAHGPAAHAHAPSGDSHASAGGGHDAHASGGHNAGGAHH